MTTFCSWGWLPDITTEINDGAWAVPDVCKLCRKKGKERSCNVCRWHSCSESKADYEDLQKDSCCLLLIGDKIAEKIQCQFIYYNTWEKYYKINMQSDGTQINCYSGKWTLSSSGEFSDNIS